MSFLFGYVVNKEWDTDFGNKVIMFFSENDCYEENEVNEKNIVPKLPNSV
jgi:hypothetical protein